jgi:hypothetical protein
MSSSKPRVLKGASYSQQVREGMWQFRSCFETHPRRVAELQPGTSLESDSVADVSAFLVVPKDTVVAGFWFATINPFMGNNQYQNNLQYNYNKIFHHHYTSLLF